MLFSFNHHLHQDYLFFYKETFEGVSLVLKEFNDGLGGAKLMKRVEPKTLRIETLLFSQRTASARFYSSLDNPLPPRPWEATCKSRTTSASGGSFLSEFYIQRAGMRREPAKAGDGSSEVHTCPLGMATRLPTHFT